MTQEQTRTRRKLGLMGGMAVMVGVGCFLMALAGLVNTLFDLKLAIGVAGSSKTPLPDSYGLSLAIAAIGALFVGLAYFGNFVTNGFKAAKGRPLVRVGIILAALAFLFIIGRGAQLVALKKTYGSMLAYYCTDGNLDDVRDELAKGPDTETLDRSVSRAAQYNNVAALELLIGAGANFEQSSYPEEGRGCVIGTGQTVEFIQAAIRLGATPSQCKYEALIEEMVTFSQLSDADLATTVTALRTAGWSHLAVNKKRNKTPLEVATKMKKPLTIKALQ